ncbi:MAG: hypothetical protein MRY83_04295, partial [Flavobacteriales bacterium]|nr:hypothetical protein [Flavobacteriales bacterium]
MDDLAQFELKSRYKILKSPLFVLGLVLLLVNDFYLKSEFGKWWTGKLSDIAGLFIFPLFLTVLFPKRVKESFIFTGLGFTLWKLPQADSIIDFINEFGIPIGRTIDHSDLLTLFTLPISYIYLKSEYFAFRINHHSLALISFFAFCATTIPPHQEKKYVDINKVYEFDFSRSSLIERLNRLSAKKIYKSPEYPEIQFKSESNLFHYKMSGDTVAVLLDESKISDGDTIHYETVVADFIITGNDSSSSLKFITAYKFAPVYSDKDYRKK